MKITAVTLTIPEREHTFLKPLLEAARRWSYPPDEWLILSGPEDIGTKRNQAVADAKGDAIVFLDDDDWHHPLRLEKQVAALQGFPEGMIGTSNFYVHDVRTGRVTYSRTWGGAACYPAGSMAFWRKPALQIGFAPGAGTELAFQAEWERRHGSAMSLAHDWWEQRAGGYYQHENPGRSCDMRDASLYVLQRHGANISPDSWCMNIWEVPENELRTVLGKAWFER